MHRPTLLFGGLLIIAMCLVPPFKTGPIDDVADALRGEDVQKVEYHPVWTQPSVEGDGLLSQAQDWEVAWKRLFFQLLAVSVVTGGVAYKVGA